MIQYATLNWAVLTWSNVHEPQLFTNLAFWIWRVSSSPLTCCRLVIGCTRRSIAQLGVAPAEIIEESINALHNSLKGKESRKLNQWVKGDKPVRAAWGFCCGTRCRRRVGYSKMAPGRFSSTSSGWTRNYVPSGSCSVRKRGALE